MDNIGEIMTFTEKGIDKTGNIIKWFNIPKEEAREHLLDLIKNDTQLTKEQQVALIYNSRKLTREYANSKAIYEEAKRQFNSAVDEDVVDEDWLHMFFDRAEKVSNESMQLIWARLLAGEFNKPGSVSRKLMHIISIMDVNSAKSFQTFCNYVFESYGLVNVSYSTNTIIIPEDFDTDSLSFVLKTEKWLSDIGYLNYKDLALELTLNSGELNSLENLGLIQRVRRVQCCLPLIYSMNDGKEILLNPKDDAGFPEGGYSFTTEGTQLYNLIGCRGCEASLEIIKQYLNNRDIKYETIDINR